MDPKTLDPKGLMKDAYSIEGIVESECRSIFLDWALGLPIDATARDWIEQVLSLYAADYPDHPMTRVLQEGLAEAAQPRRRGGRGARMRHADN